MGQGYTFTVLASDWDLAFVTSNAYTIVISPKNITPVSETL